VQKKSDFFILLTARRTTLGNTLPYLFGNIFEFVDKSRAIDLVKHVPRFFFAIQNPGFMHEIQMPGNYGSVLRQMVGYGSDIGSPVFHQKLQYLQPNRLTQGFEKS
jgi:hypothetical protein